MPYPTWVEVNLSAVERNVRNLIKKTGVPLLAVVKANSYGLGAVEVSRAALDAGATWLGVARYIEARQLRRAGIQAPILVLGMVTPEEVDEAIADHVALNLHSCEVADIFARRGKALGKPVSAHLKVDTGMGRLGVQPEEIVTLARYAQEQGYIEADGLFSQFATAETVGDWLVPVQLARFKSALQALNEAGFYPKWVHLSNTAGAMLYPEAKFSMVRAASGVVGIWPLDYNLPYPEELTPVFTWKARLASCKKLPAGWTVGYGSTYVLPEDELLGVVPVGYGDGLRRAPYNEVLIGGQRVPVRGKVCMDQVMIHLPKPYPIGEEVVVLGEQGDERIRLEDLALRYQVAQVDVAANISLRVPRVYVRD